MSKNLRHLTEDEFELIKFKVVEKHVEVDFIELRKEKKGIIKIPFTASPPYTIHKDLNDILHQLKEVVLKQRGHYKLYHAGKKVKAVQEAWAELLENTEVTGFKIVGKDNLRGCIVTAKIKTDAGTHGVLTKTIVFESDIQGYEADVEEIIIAATKEIYKLMYDGKKGNADLFTLDPTVAESQEVSAEKKKAQLVS